MKSRTTVVCYHYVRDEKFKLSSGAGKYSIDTESFRNQLEYFEQYYKLISPEAFINSAKGKEMLPDKSLLLTFDDGYIDHYKSVYPVLKAKRIKAFFFPSAKPIFEKKLLDANKIQLIFETATARTNIYYDLFRYLKSIKYRDHSLVLSRFKACTSDSQREGYAYKLLQKELPLGMRKEVLDQLFARYVGRSEIEEAGKLYMSFDQLKEMQNNGMFIGCHGYNHYWMDTLSPELQNDEIQKSIELQKKLCVGHPDLVMCYPYGAYNQELVSLLKDNGFIMAFTTEGGIIKLKNENMFTLPRIDTKEFPLEGNDKPNHWTQKILTD